MNKRFWVNMIIAILAKPVDMILVYTKMPIELRCLWLGVALACCINGVANSFANE